MATIPTVEVETSEHTRIFMESIERIPEPGDKIRLYMEYPFIGLFHEDGDFVVRELPILTF
jgi:hypothetical protein